MTKTNDEPKEKKGTDKKTMALAVVLLALILLGPGALVSWLVTLLLTSFGIGIGFLKVWACIIVGGMVIKMIKD